MHLDLLHAGLLERWVVVPEAAELFEEMHMLFLSKLQEAGQAVEEDGSSARCCWTGS